MTTPNPDPDNTPTPEGSTEMFIDITDKESEVAAVNAAPSTYPPHAQIMIDATGSQTNGITASFELITPVEAQAILDGSDFTNRPMRRAVVERYAEAMTNDEWKLAPEPLVITADGNLIQGQHRLTAVALSMRTQWFMVVRGWRTEVFDVLDSGAKRSVSDVLSINGTAGANGSRLGSAAKLLVGLSIAKANGYSAHNVTKRATDRQQIISFAEDNAEMLQWAYRVTEPLYRARVVAASPTSMLGAAFLIHQAGNDKDIVETFFQELSTLHDLNDPRWTLIRWRMTGKSRSGKMEMATAVIVKAWNAWVRGVKPQQFAWRVDEDFPTPLTFA